MRLLITICVLCFLGGCSGFNNKKCDMWIERQTLVKEFLPPPGPGYVEFYKKEPYCLRWAYL